MTVYTAMCRAVHHQVLSGGTATFFPRVVSSVQRRGGHRHGDGGAPPYFSREKGFQGVGWGGTAIPRLVPPSPVR